MPRFARLRATEVRDVRPGLARMTLSDGSEAYALTELCGPVAVGNELLVNTTALDIPIPRQGTVEECSALAVFLASEQASYITGQAYLVNGGAHFL